MVPYQNDAHNQQPQKTTTTQRVKGSNGNMEKLTITAPSDVLGFWPQASLVRITKNDHSIGPTLRIDLPRQPGQELPYARTVARYLTSDTTATSILFAIHTSETAVRDGLLFGDESFSPTTAHPAPASPCPSAPPKPARFNRAGTSGQTCMTPRPSRAVTAAMPWSPTCNPLLGHESIGTSRTAPLSRSVRNRSSTALSGLSDKRCVGPGRFHW